MAKPRLRLIVNPVATSVSERTVRTVLGILESQCDVELIETRRRGHAIELAREAVAGGSRPSLPWEATALPTRCSTARATRFPWASCRPAGRACCHARFACRAISEVPPRSWRRRSSRDVSAASTSASSTAGASRSPQASAPTPRPSASSTTGGGRGASGRATPTSRRRSCARCCAATSASHSSTSFSATGSSRTA